MASAERERDPILEALALVSDGASIRQACAQVGMAKMTLWDRLNSGEYAVHYAKARELQAEHDAARIEEVVCELLHLARTAPDTITQAQVNAYRTAADKLQWAAARKHPKVYGDRIDLTVEHKNELTIVDYSKTVRTIDVTPTPLTLASSTDAQAAPILRKRTRGPDKKPRKRRAPTGGGGKNGE